ncbi:MAG: solute carrier family 23 protein [Thermodesulfobacteriota bacterium]
MDQKPETLIYGREDRPPLRDMLLLGLQHIFLMSSTLVLPVVLVNNIGGDSDEVEAVVCLTMIAAGLGTIVQSLRLGPLGSGYLVPNLAGPSFFGVSMRAAWMGGLPLMHGMILVAGVFEALFSRVVHRVRFLFPANVTGLVVLMVAVGLIPVGTCKFLGVENQGDLIKPANLAVAFLTLGCMVGINVWSRSRIRLYSVLVGMVSGYAASFAFGLLSLSDFLQVAAEKWVSLPMLSGVSFHWAFSWELVLPFCIVSLCVSLKAFGNLITAQRINDPDWSEPEMKSIGNGLLADSVSVLAAGLLGGMATDTSASNVGLSLATRATSRRIAWACGGLFIFLGFFPKLGALFSIMPPPVMGSILIFVTSYMVLSGFQIILSSKPDQKHIFVIGIAFIFGLSVDLLPGLYADVPHVLKPLFGSSLTLSTVLAILLNQVLFARKAKQG